MLPRANFTQADALERLVASQGYELILEPMRIATKALTSLQEGDLLSLGQDLKFCLKDTKGKIFHFYYDRKRQQGRIGKVCHYRPKGKDETLLYLCFGRVESSLDVTPTVSLKRVMLMTEEGCIGYGNVVKRGEKRMLEIKKVEA